MNGMRVWPELALDYQQSGNTFAEIHAGILAPRHPVLPLTFRSLSVADGVLPTKRRGRRYLGAGPCRCLDSYRAQEIKSRFNMGSRSKSNHTGPMEKLKLQELSQEIVLLRMLTAEPATPTQNANCSGKLDLSLPPRRKISLQREFDFVENLTFISATSENPENVIALCMEEQLQSNSCTFRIAMNTKLPKEFLNGMRAVARVLEKACSQSKWHRCTLCFATATS